MITKQGTAARAAWALPLLRVAPGQVTQLTVQSESIIYFELHWLDKNYVCPGDGCPSCCESLARMKGYFIALVHVGDRSTSCLVEAPPSSIQRLLDQIAMEQGVLKPGLQLTVHRRAKNRSVSFDLGDEGGRVIDQLTPDHRTLSATAVLFGLPLPRREETTDEYVLRAEPVARNLLLMATKLGR